MATGLTSTASFRGISEDQAQSRLKSEGYNELPQQDRRTPIRIFVEVMREPMLILLLASGAIYLLLGDTTDALILVALATMSVAITVTQESRTERILEALRDLTSPRALVIRDGERKRIAGREVVRGDIIVLGEGDRVPADAVLYQAHDLQADESLLTGESVPVHKTANDKFQPTQSQRPGGDGLSFVYSGSLIVRGAGIGEVTAIGASSEIGQIGHSLSTLEEEQPRLQMQTRKLVQIFAILGGVVCVLAVLLYGFTRGDWLEGILAGIALGMSLLPEEFPVVLTVFMAMGAWRISRERVLTRRAAAIETLGSATVLCTDKTGTLTENRMSVAELRLKDGSVFDPRETTDKAMPEDFQSLVDVGLLASAPVPVDPMDKAFHALDHGPHGLKLVHAYGLRPGLLAVSQVWQEGESRQRYSVAAKGAPEAIAELCKFNRKDREALTATLSVMAAEGLRVLGVARATFAGKKWPISQQDFAFNFVGLVGLADPIRPSVPTAVRECHSAGIRVIMITGDYPATAKAIAQQAGFNPQEVITGEDLKTMSDEDLAVHVKTAMVFARIMSEQKLRIVNALKSIGEVVAMTGDGVNDAPSLKAAHIGVAMGGRGTDVAREASSIVLLDDDFGSIVKTIKLGRRIYDNLRKAMGFVIAVHVPIAGLALLPLLFGLPILFGPMHIAFLEMVIDPVCSLVFENETEEDDVMRRPPRAPEEPLFTRSLIGWSVLQGTVSLVLVAAIFLSATYRGMPENEVRALAFFSLVMTIVGLIIVNRSFSASLAEAILRPNSTLVMVLVVVSTILGLTLLWPFASNLFRFGPLHFDDLSLTLGAGIFVLLLLEALKSLWRRRKQSTMTVSGTS